MTFLRRTICHKNTAGIVLIVYSVVLLSIHVYVFPSDPPQRNIEFHRGFESIAKPHQERIHPVHGVVESSTSQTNPLYNGWSYRFMAMTSLKDQISSTRLDNWLPYYYNHTRFQNEMIRWRSQNNDNLHILVLIQQHISLTFPSKALIQTIQDSLRSKLAQVLVYLTNYDNNFISIVTDTFATAIESGQLLLLLSEKDPLKFGVVTDYPDLIDGFNYAFLLELTFQSGSNFTMVLPAGWRLNDNATLSDYADLAHSQYAMIEKTRQQSNDPSRTCWTVLSDTNTSDVIFLDTAEHASRMSVLLLSSLPYNQKPYTELRGLYCNLFISHGKVVHVPPLFTNTSYASEQPQSLVSIASKSHIAENEISTPIWIDPSLNLGPHMNDIIPPYRIAFGVTAMIRERVGTSYLESFMTYILDIVETHFQQNKKYSATIVVLVGGSNLTEIHSLRKFLESKYATEINKNCIKLVDSPLDLHEVSMNVMRPTYILESFRRRYWRSKQNLDISTLLTATVGLSEYVMLLEDDTGFQPEFASRLKSFLDEDTMANHLIFPPWSQAVFGFGYSGMLVRSIDVPVFAQLHTTFFDEKPCDLLDIWRVVPDGKRNYVYSPAKLNYKKGSYLKHFGLQSSLQGKTQLIW